MTSSPASESLEHARFAVVDVETTGVRAQVGGRILEVAVAILEGGTIHLAFEALLDPGTPIPLWVARLTGITDGMVAGRPRFGDVVAGFGRALDAAVFVAHNARFDWRFLAAEYALAGVPAPGGKPLCTVRLTRRLVPELRRRGLDHVAAFFGIENPARHRAFGDALATARSEEHTSELQSRVDLVCRLLLEKKKKPTERPPPTALSTLAVSPAPPM